MPLPLPSARSSVWLCELLSAPRSVARLAAAQAALRQKAAFNPAMNSSAALPSSGCHHKRLMKNRNPWALHRLSLLVADAKAAHLDDHGQKQLISMSMLAQWPDRS